MASRRGNTLAIPFELDSAIDEREWNPEIRRLLRRLYRRNNRPSDYNEGSGDEDSSWPNESVRRSHNNALIDENEAGEPGSDDEEGEGSRVSANEQNARRRDALEDRVSTATRDILEREFGDRWRRVQPPSGRGWENVRGIAEGQRITEDLYGLSRDAIRNTSLEDPPVPRNSRPPYSQAVQRAAEAEERQQHEQQIARAEAVLYARRHPHTVECERELEDLQRSGDDRVAGEELIEGATRWALRDPQAYNEWKDFCAIARRCTDSKARQYQIIGWYTGGPRGHIKDPDHRVPGSILRKVYRLENYYTRLVRLEYNVYVAEVNEGSRDEEPQGQRQRDSDDWWSANSYGGPGALRCESIGWESRESLNSFSDYVPRGEGETLLDHLSANWQARRVRLYHASVDEYDIIHKRVLLFIPKVKQVLSELAQLGEGLADDFNSRVLEQRALLDLFEQREMPTSYRRMHGHISTDTAMSDDGDAEEGLTIPQWHRRTIREAAINATHARRRQDERIRINLRENFRHLNVPYTSRLAATGPPLGFAPPIGPPSQDRQAAANPDEAAGDNGEGTAVVAADVEEGEIVEGEGDHDEVE